MKKNLKNLIKSQFDWEKANADFKEANKNRSCMAYFYPNKSDSDIKLAKMTDELSDYLEQKKNSRKSLIYLSSTDRIPNRWREWGGYDDISLMSIYEKTAKDDIRIEYFSANREDSSWHNEYDAAVRIMMDGDWLVLTADTDVRRQQKKILMRHQPVNGTKSWLAEDKRFEDRYAKLKIPCGWSEFTGLKQKGKNQLEKLHLLNKKDLDDKDHYLVKEIADWIIGYRSFTEYELEFPELNKKTEIIQTSSYREDFWDDWTDIEIEGFKTSSPYNPRKDIIPVEANIFFGRMTDIRHELLSKSTAEQLFKTERYDQNLVDKLNNELRLYLEQHRSLGHTEPAP